LPRLEQEPRRRSQQGRRVRPACSPQAAAPTGGASFLLIAHRNTRRITEVAVCITRAICHVASNNREHAEWLTTFTVGGHGLPKSAVKARALPRRDDT
jgi:hypothetical protein